MKELPKEWTEYLSGQPETGMGYQVTAVTLHDGRRVENVAIIESHIIGEVRGYADIPFEPNEIVKIEVTHRKWQFNKMK